MNSCESCGVCCRLFMITLTEEEYKSGKYKTQFENFDMIEDFGLAEECGANIIEQKDNGSCIYLKDKRCSVHRIRPKVCRAFFCDSKNSQFAGMIEEINSVKEE